MSGAASWFDDNFDVRRCVATIVAAIRVAPSITAVTGQRSFTPAELWRSWPGRSATLAICDPVPRAVFGARSLPEAHPAEHLSFEGKTVTFLPKLSLMASAVAFAAGAPPAVAQARDGERPWWEKSNCQGIEGMSWIECQKAVSQNKRDRKAGRQPSNQAWWDKSKCLGLEGISWANCQKSRSAAKRNDAPSRDPWATNQCIGLEGLAFVECHKARKRRER